MQGIKYGFEKKKRLQQILFGEDQSSTLAISAEPAPLMSSACSRPPKILNGRHDDDDDIEGDDDHGDEDEEGKNDENGDISAQPILGNTVMLDFGEEKTLNVLAFPNFSVLNGICMFFDDVI